MILNRKIPTMIAMLLIVVVLSIVVKPYNDTVFVSTRDLSMPTIILDAGHGGLTNTID